MFVTPTKPPNNGFATGNGRDISRSATSTPTVTSSSWSTPSLGSKSPHSGGGGRGRGGGLVSPPHLKEKADEINLLLLQPEVDLWRLRELALSEGGLVNDTLRQRAWPKLVGLDHNYDPLPMWLGVDHDGSSPSATPGPVSDHPMQEPQLQFPIDTTPRFEIDASELNAHNNLPPRSGTLLVESMDAAQIERDVARCTWHLLTGSQRSRRVQYKNKQRNKKMASLLKRKQRRLANLINLTLVESYPRVATPDQRLRYYQGYHDVACIFLHALGGATVSASAGPDDNRGRHGSSVSVEDEKEQDGTTTTPMQTPTKETLTTTKVNGGRAVPTSSPALSTASTPSSPGKVGAAGLELPSKVLCQVSFSHFGDALQSNFVQLQTALKLVLFPLLHTLDPTVHGHLHDADMEPFFCLSWVLTWFAHDVRDTDVVKRLFDAFLVSHPLLPVYTAIAMMLHPYNRRAILDTDCDFAALHQCLAGLPKHSCRVGWKRRREEGALYVSDDENEGDHPTHDALHREAERLQEALAITKEERAFRQEGREGCDGDTRSDDGDHEWISLKDGDDRTATTADLEFHSKSTNSVVSTGGQWNSPPGGGSTTASTKNASPFLNGSTWSDPVPFEEVVVTALQYMKRYPPNSLVDLAKRYYQDDWHNQVAFLRHAGTSSTNQCTSPLDVQRQIGLLRPAPAWSIVPHCTADWVVKQRLRQTLGLKATSRKNRRRKKNYSPMTNGNAASPLMMVPPSPSAISSNSSVVPSKPGQVATTTTAHFPTVDPMKYVRANPYNWAVIAVGYGPGLRPELIAAAAAKRRRRKLVIAAVVLGILAVGASCVVYQLQRTSDGMAPSSALFSTFLGHHDGDTCNAPTTSTMDDDSIKELEAAAMKKAASVILPRLNVLQQARSPLSSNSNRKTPGAGPLVDVPQPARAPLTSIPPPKTTAEPKSSTAVPTSDATLPGTSTSSGRTTKSSSTAASSSLANQETLTSVSSPHKNKAISIADKWRNLALHLNIKAKQVVSHFVNRLFRSLRRLWTFWISRKTTSDSH